MDFYNTHAEEHADLTGDLSAAWQRGLLMVASPKTEHHEGHDCRVVPLFPELRPYLSVERRFCHSFGQGLIPAREMIRISCVRRH